MLTWIWRLRLRYRFRSLPGPRSILLRLLVSIKHCIEPRLHAGDGRLEKAAPY